MHNYLRSLSISLKKQYNKNLRLNYCLFIAWLILYQHKGVWLWELSTNLGFLMRIWETFFPFQVICCNLVDPCVHMLSAAGLSTCLDIGSLHWHPLRYDGYEVAFQINSLMYFSDVLMWHSVQRLFCYLLRWAQYILGLLQIKFSNDNFLVTLNLIQSIWHLMGWIIFYMGRSCLLRKWWNNYKVVFKNIKICIIRVNWC